MRITQIAPSRRGRPGVVTWAPLAPTTPPAGTGTPPRAGGEIILLCALRSPPGRLDSVFKVPKAELDHAV